MLNIKVNNSSGDVVAKTVPRKRTRLPANTASPVEKGKRQKKIIQESTNNKNDCVSKSTLDALVSYTNNTTHTTSTTSTATTITTTTTTSTACKEQRNNQSY